MNEKENMPKHKPSSLDYKGLVNPEKDREKFEQIQDELEELLEERVGSVKGRLGGCRVYWACKKRILKEKYDIEWRSPKELYSQVMFD